MPVVLGHGCGRPAQAWVCAPACHETDRWQAAIEWSRSQAGIIATLKLPASNEGVMLGQAGSAMHSAAAMQCCSPLCQLPVGTRAISQDFESLTVSLPAHSCILCSAGVVGQATESRAFSRSKLQPFRGWHLRVAQPPGQQISHLAQEPGRLWLRQHSSTSKVNICAYALLVSTAPCSGSRAATGMQMRSC